MLLPHSPLKEHLVYNSDSTAKPDFQPRFQEIWDDPEIILESIVPRLLIFLLE